MNRRRSPKRARCGFRHPQVAHLPRAHELGHRADRFLDRHVQIHAMLVVEIDDVDAQPPERRVARLAHVLRRSVYADVRSGRVAHVPELRREHDRGPPIPDSSSDQNFVRMRAIHVGGIEKRDAEIQGPMNRPRGLLIVAPRVELGHAHTPKPNRGNGWAVCTELSDLVMFRYILFPALRMHSPILAAS